MYHTSRFIELLFPFSSTIMVWCAHCYINVYRLISKYHPKHISSREEAQKISLKSRLESFIFLLESGRLDDVPLWSDCADEIVSTMDSGE